MAFSNWKQKGSPSVSLIVIIAFVIKNVFVIVFVDIFPQGDANRKEAELLSYKRRQEQLQNDLMNTSMENRLPLFSSFLDRKKKYYDPLGNSIVYRKSKLWKIII